MAPEVSKGTDTAPSEQFIFDVLELNGCLVVSLVVKFWLIRFLSVTASSGVQTARALPQLVNTL